MEYQKSFSVRYGNKNHMFAEVKVKDGKICWVHNETYHYNHGTRSGFSVRPENKDFDFCVETTLNTLFQKLSKYDYEKLLEALDQETLDKYFKKSYIPK